jgi:signal transduction histidine kinase
MDFADTHERPERFHVRIAADYPNIAGFRFVEGEAAVAVTFVESQWAESRSLRRLMMNADSILIGVDNEIIAPNLNFVPASVASEIIFLSTHYVANRAAFENDAMVRVAGAENTYYLMSSRFSIAPDVSFSVLLYTDITSAITFMNSINFTIGILLLSSAVVGALISILLSAKVQRAIMRLCEYAEIIGHGNFGEKPGAFEYKEFNNLAQSLNTMSNMLEAGESNRKQFFQNVSHELRTPLMSIQGYAEGILTNVLDKEDACKIILSESERMEDLVRRILYISRMDSGLDALDIAKINVKNLLYDCAERIKILAEKKEIAFDFPSTDTEIKSDEGMLQQAIDNILSNCIRHAKTKISISYHTDEKNTVIEISDDGDGISQEDLPHIFERFYKGANGNSGLGLAICRDTIERLGGKITAHTSEKGAKFIIFLPQAPVS